MRVKVFDRLSKSLVTYWLMFEYLVDGNVIAILNISFFHFVIFTIHISFTCPSFASNIKNSPK